MKTLGEIILGLFIAFVILLIAMPTMICTHSCDKQLYQGK